MIRSQGIPRTTIVFMRCIEFFIGEDFVETTLSFPFVFVSVATLEALQFGLRT
jgi:hypothetical protein